MPSKKRSGEFQMGIQERERERKREILIDDYMT